MESEEWINAKIQKLERELDQLTRYLRHKSRFTDETLLATYKIIDHKKKRIHELQNDLIIINLNKK